MQINSQIEKEILRRLISAVKLSLEKISYLLAMHCNTLHLILMMVILMILILIMLL